MITNKFPDNLNNLYTQEQFLREKAMCIIHEDSRLLLHLNAIERAMSLIHILIGCPRNDEDFKVIKMLGIRMFNAFGSSLTLMLSGYHQKSALVMRDTLETVFLIDLFKTDTSAIERWRFANEKILRQKFSPVVVRKFLDERDGNSTKKREETYKMFCNLAAHPSMHSQHMLKPQKGGDIVMGPFMEKTSLQAGIYELGKLAIQAGEIIDAFLPKGWDQDFVRVSFSQIKEKWILGFYK